MGIAAVLLYYKLNAVKRLSLERLVNRSFHDRVAEKRKIAAGKENGEKGRRKKRQSFEEDLKKCVCVWVFIIFAFSRIPRRQTRGESNIHEIGPACRLQTYIGNPQVCELYILAIEVRTTPVITVKMRARR